MILRALTLNILHTNTHTVHMTKHSQTLKCPDGTIKVIKSVQSTRAWNCSLFQCYQSHTEFKSGRKQHETWPLTGPCCSGYWHAKSTCMFLRGQRGQGNMQVMWGLQTNAQKQRDGLVFCAWLCFLFPQVRNQWGHAWARVKPKVSVKWVYSKLLLAGVCAG